MANKPTYSTEDKIKISEGIGAFVQGNEALATERLGKFLESSNDNIIEQLEEISFFLSKHAKDYHNDKIKYILSPIIEENGFYGKDCAMVMGRIKSEIPNWEEIVKQDKNPKIKEATIVERIIPTKNSAQETATKKSTQPLIRLLSRIESHKSEDYTKGISVIEDKDNGEKTTFNTKEIMVGNKSSITYINKNKKIQNKVSIDQQKENTLILSHKKETGVYPSLVADTIMATVDYMTEKGQIPFVLNINSKTNEYREAVAKTLFAFSKAFIKQIKNRNQKILQSKALDNVSAFKFDGVEIKKEELLKANSEEEFLKKITSLQNAKKDNDNKKAEEILKQKIQENTIPIPALEELAQNIK